MLLEKNCCKKIAKKLTQRSLSLIWGHGAHGGDPLPTPHVAREPAHLADDALPCEADHQAGAVVALERRGEGAHNELVGARLQNVGRGRQTGA